MLDVAEILNESNERYAHPDWVADMMAEFRPLTRRQRIRRTVRRWTGR